MAVTRRRPAALLALALLALGASSCAWMNGRVTRELYRDPQGERAAEVMLLTLPSGKRIPVNYLRDDAVVYAAADFPWWRELRDGGDVEVWIQGETLRGHGRAVRDDPAHRDAVFDRLRPTAPKVFGTLIEIRLEPASAP